MNPLIISSIGNEFRLGIQPLLEDGRYLTFAVALTVDLAFYKERILKAYFWPNKLEDFLIKADQFISEKNKSNGLRLETPDSFLLFRFDRPKLSNLNIEGLCLYVEYSLAEDSISRTKNHRYSSTGDFEISENSLSALVHFFRESIAWSENGPSPMEHGNLLSSFWLSFNG